MLRRLLSALITPFKQLKIVLEFPAYFDPDERHLVTASIIIGGVVWLLVTGLSKSVHWLFHQNIHWLEHAASPWLLFVPLLVGALIVASIARFRASFVHYRDQDNHIHELLDAEGDGVERTIALYYASEPALEQALLGSQGVDVRWELPTFSLALRKWLATLVTLGSGGSGGLEASVVLIGETTAAALFKPRPWLERLPDNPMTRGLHWLRTSSGGALRPDTLQTVQLAGVAAAVSTLLGAPLAAAFFATEVMYKRRPVIEKLLYALVAALCAFLLSYITSGGHPHTLFSVESLIPPPNTVPYLAAVIIVGLCVSLFDAYFSQMQSSFAASFHRLIPNIWLRHLTGAAITGLVALAAMAATGYGFELILGMGESIIGEALDGTLPLKVAFIGLIAKLFATLSTIGSGGSAGLLVPSIFFGSMVGVLVAGLFGLPPMTLVIPSITASLVATVNVPLAAILVTIELFGTSYMLPSLVVLIVTLIFAHENSIYRTQRDWDESRAILPGYSVRRVAVPESWDGQTISQLGLRLTYDVNVVGLIEAERVENQPFNQRIRPHVSPSKPLRVGDMLIVMGKDEQIDMMVEKVG